MNPSTRHTLLGFVGGSLMTLGFGLVAAYATLGLFLHHMFIIGVHSAVGLLFFAFPALLILAGAVLTLRAFQSGTAISTSRSALGLLLLLFPLLLLATVPFFGVLLGSLGMDIHWTASKTVGYGAVACAAIMLCLSFLFGWRLLHPNTSKD